VNSLDPRLPLGRRVELPRQGTTFVREVAGPPGAPTVLLLHGWVASGGMNWFRVFAPLAQHFDVLAPDLRGHARGLRSRRVFRLADCADDCAATLVALGKGPVVAVGYSMGGPVAQLLWRRHRDLVAGLVLCATAGGFIPQRGGRRAFQSTMLAGVAAARLVAAVRPPAFPTPAVWPRALPAWAVAEMRRHDWRMIVEAGHSLSTYNARRWTAEIDVPTAVVCTTEDRAVAPDLQYALANAISGATLHPVADGHLACTRRSFASVLVDACLEVASRARGRDLLRPPA